MADSIVATGSKVEGHTENPNNKQDDDEATEKNIEKEKSTGIQGIEVELKKSEDSIKDDEDDDNPNVTKTELKGKMTTFLSHFITPKKIKSITLNLIQHVSYFRERLQRRQWLSVLQTRC